MLRAEIQIKAFNENGEGFDFSYYVLNTENMTENAFKDYIILNANAIAETNCDVSYLDFVGVKCVDFEDVEVD